MSKFQNSNVFMSLKIGLILANSVIPDEMPRCTAFYLFFHCLPNYLLTGIQNEKGLNNQISSRKYKGLCSMCDQFKVSNMEKYCA